MTSAKIENPALIVPLGSFPHPLGEQVIDRGAAMRILNKLKKTGRDIVVDYRHESMNQCGQAPAAGWVKTREARLSDKGIFAPIEWTEEAERLIANKKYLYLSPVFEARGGKIVGLVNLGLTNNPNIDSMPPLLTENPGKEKRMKKETEKTIKTILGLPDEAACGEVAKAVEALASAASEKPSIASLLGDAVALLGLAPDAADDEVRERIGVLARRAASAGDEKAERMVNDAVAAGRLRPSLREWAIGVGRDNPESLRVFLANSGPAVPLGGVMTAERISTRPALTESEAKVCRLLNISEGDFTKYGGGME